MINIILVDDETAALRGLGAASCWDEYGFNIAGMFTKAADVLEYLKSNKADAVITDIRMPLMSGIDLAREIHGLYPDIIVIFISAYEDFEYARGAIKYNVTDYLLKPIDHIQLEEICEKIKLKCLREKSIWNENELEMMYYQQLVTDYFGGKNKKEFEDVLKINGLTLESPSAIIEINIRNFVDFLKTKWKHGVDRFYFCIIKTMPINGAMLIPLNYSFGVITVILISRTDSYEDFKNHLKEFSINASEQYMQLLGVDAGINILRTAEGFVDLEKNIKNIVRLTDNEISEFKSMDTISKAKDYIDKNYFRDIPLSEIAEYVSMSPYYFSKIFKRETGENFSNFLNKRRIDAACEFLIKSDYKTEQIYKMVGYNSKNYFFKLFKLYMGVTPQEYRSGMMQNGER